MIRKILKKTPIKLKKAHSQVFFFKVGYIGWGFFWGWVLKELHARYATINLNFILCIKKQDIINFLKNW